MIVNQNITVIFTAKGNQRYHIYTRECKSLAGLKKATFALHIFEDQSCKDITRTRVAAHHVYVYKYAYICKCAYVSI